MCEMSVSGVAPLRPAREHGPDSSHAGLRTALRVSRGEILQTVKPGYLLDCEK